MARIKKRFTVLCEQNIKNLEDKVVKQRFIYYFATDTLSMAESMAASLQRINHSWRIVDANAVHNQQWIREGFHESE